MAFGGFETKPMAAKEYYQLADGRKAMLDRGTWFLVTEKPGGVRRFDVLERAPDLGGASKLGDAARQAKRKRAFVKQGRRKGAAAKPPA